MGLAILKSVADAARALPGTSDPSKSGAGRTMDVALLTAASVLLADLVIYRVILLLPAAPEEVIIRPFFYRMDTPLIFVAVATLLTLRFLPPHLGSTLFAAWCWRRPGLVLAGCSLFVIAISWLGASQVMLGFHLSRDEQMAASDAAMLADGNLMAPIPREWRSYADALQYLFAQFTDGATHWVSVYFPFNAWIRSLFLRVGIPDAANPVVAAIAVWLAYDVARKLWPERRDAAVVAAVLVAASAQVLVNAMTPYATTLHLTLTLLWLRFWLRNDGPGHAGAIATGFFAVGIHQIAFHALFVAPFVLSLWLSRRFRLAFVYSTAYALIGLAWLSYWTFAAWYMGASLPAAPGGGFAELVGKIVPVLQDLSIAGFLYVPLLLLKFVAWQHILFLPLLLAAFANLRTMPVVLKLSLAAAALTLAVVFVVMPYQGHGWGYRYLHGFIGPFALAAAFGWVKMVPPQSSPERSRGQLAFALTTVVTLIVSLPVLARELRDYNAPYARAQAHLELQDVDIVVIDHLGSRAGGLVSNAHDLTNRPRMMALANLDDRQLRDLCARYSVAFFGIDQMRAFGLDAFDRGIKPDIKRVLDHRRQVMRDAGCVSDVGIPAAMR